jgi:hypothetical protein
LFETPLAAMQGDYLRGYHIFRTEVQKMWPRYLNLIKESKDDLEGQLYCLLGLSKCKLEAPAVREDLFKNIIELINAKAPMRLESVLDGLYGIAL